MSFVHYHFKAFNVCRPFCSASFGVFCTLLYESKGTIFGKATHIHMQNIMYGYEMQTMCSSWVLSSNFNLYSLLSQLWCIIAHIIIVTIVWHTWFLPCKWCVILAYFRMFPFHNIFSSSSSSSFPFSYVHLEHWMFSLQSTEAKHFGLEIEY